MVAARHESKMIKVVPELMEEFQDLAFFVQYFDVEDVPDTVIGNLEEAMRRYLEEMRRQLNDGKRFPKAKGELRQGRPPKRRDDE